MGSKSFPHFVHDAPRVGHLRVCVCVGNGRLVKVKEDVLSFIFNFNVEHFPTSTITSTHYLLTAISSHRLMGAVNRARPPDDLALT